MAAKVGLRERIGSILFFGGLCLILTAFLPSYVRSMTAKEILEEVVKRNFLDSFRVVLSVETIKGKKAVSKHSLWLMCRTQDQKSDFVVDFEEPKESKGLRFLIQIRPDKGPSAFMYLPATGKTLPLAVDDPSADIGGTGLSMADLQAFMPQGDEAGKVVKEEQAEGRDCYVVSIQLPKGEGERLLWISKDGFLVIKTQQVDAKGHVQRIFRVAEFFKTDRGTEFPREEEVTIPDKNIKIRLRQEHAVFGIEFPEEIMDPEKFGSFKWKN